MFGVGLFGAAAAAAYFVIARPWLLRWGATEADSDRPLPGDELVAGALYRATRAIEIDAPVEKVWPWLVQLGQGRGGFYTYDELENLFGLNIHSAETIVPDLQKLQVGDVVRLAPGNAEVEMTVAQLEPNKLLVLRTHDAQANTPQPAGDYFKGQIAGTWAFVLEPLPGDRSRLVVRFRSAWRPSGAAEIANLLLLEPVHFIMERGMLQGIKQRTERAG
jgi:uncharacterized protein YndB with AHSA1/START domain